jgi:hypothetical protein
MHNLMTLADATAELLGATNANGSRAARPSASTLACPPEQRGVNSAAERGHQLVVQQCARQATSEWCSRCVRQATGVVQQCARQATRVVQQCARQATRSMWQTASHEQPQRRQMRACSTAGLDQGGQRGGCAPPRQVLQGPRPPPPRRRSRTRCQSTAISDTGGRGVTSCPSGACQVLQSAASAQ